MTIKTIRELINAEILFGEDMIDTNVESAFGSDLMSDVLAFVKERTVLITGLVNMHVFRTAQMTDVICIIFSRGKKPTQELLDMGISLKIVMLTTEHTTYEVSGILYGHGLPGVNK